MKCEICGGDMKSVYKYSIGRHIRERFMCSECGKKKDRKIGTTRNIVRERI